MTLSRPNVIWVFCDQLRAQAIGYRLDPNVRTPNIDNLTREGVRFDCAIAGTPWCTPFRGALLTGKYPHQTGVIQTPSALDPKHRTVAHAFNEAGYHTAWVGKWHLHGSNEAVHVPPEYRGGFTFWLGYENNNKQNDCWVHGTGQEEPIRLPGYETDSLTDLLREHICGHVRTSRREDGSYQPFFACLSVQPPHNPYSPPANPPYTDQGPSAGQVQLRPNVPPVDWVQEKAKIDHSGYYGMIRNIDYNVGRLRQSLKEMGVDRETFIVFFSDHGDMLGSHAQWEKSSPWEESVRIPFIVAAPSGKTYGPRGRTDAVINHVDIAPTTLGMCGIKKPDWMVGYDYSAYCYSSWDPDRPGDPDPSREPDSAYLQQIVAKQHQHSVNRTWRGVVTRDGWKYVCMEGHDWLLFNNREDPYELANYVFDKCYAEERRRCHKLLTRWIQQTGDSFTLPPV